MKIFAFVVCLLFSSYFSIAQNVGIGTDNPEKKLHIEGGLNDGIRITRIGMPVHLDLKANGNEASIGTDSNHGLRLLTNNSVRFDITNSGNVSVGTVNGPQKLNVNGGIRIGNTSINSTGAIRYFQNDFEGYNGTEWLSLTSGDSGASLWEDTDPDGVHYIDGNVGIGTLPNAAFKLHVQGLTNIGGQIELDTKSFDTSNDSGYSAGELKVESSFDNGQGTFNYKGVEILGMGDLPNDIRPEINLYNTSDQQAISLDFVSGKGIVISEGLNIQSAGSSQVNMRVTNDVNQSAEIKLYEGLNTRVEIRGNENSIGDGAAIKLYDQNNQLTIEMDADLNGKGRIITDEIEIKGGSDFAENFDIVSDIKLLPGMVVSIDPANEGKLMISHTAYDKKVAGIISGANGINPGMRMGQKNSIANGEYPVALSGRVYGYVSLEGGIIQPGDLLTTAKKTGHIMKVNDMEKAQGAIIGKAMTSVTEEGDLVLILVNLH